MHTKQNILPEFKKLENVLKISLEWKDPSIFRVRSFGNSKKKVREAK